MRGPSLIRWLAICGVAVWLAATGVPAHAEPASPAQIDVVVFGYVDAAEPACDLEYNQADQDFARSNPLPPMTFVLRDPAGNELGRQTTTALVELQRAHFSNVPDHASYTLTLEAPPAGWALCGNEQATRTITQADITLGRASAKYHFYVPGQETPVPTEPTPVVPTATVPGPTSVVPTATTRPPGPTAVRPTTVPRPTSAGDRDDDADEPEPGQPAPAQPVVVSGQATMRESGVAYVAPPAGTGELAMIRGIAFLDQDGDGRFGAGEPGLNDVQVYLHGGNLHISQITRAPGTFSFEALGDGEYDVFINPGPEWRITTPYKYVVKVRGNIVTGIDFGLIRKDAVAGAAPQAQVHVQRYPAPGQGIRLPATGVIDVPRAPLLGGLAALLGVLGLAGLAVERRSRRREDI